MQGGRKLMTRWTGTLSGGVSRRSHELGGALLRRLPPGIRRPIRDLYQKTAVKRGGSQVVPPRVFEDFLVAQLDALRREAAAPTLEGDYIEFGVFVGTSLGAAVRAFDRAGVTRGRFFGFDSFEGLPEGSESDGWTSGTFAASRSVTEWNLTRQGVLDRVTLVEGWFDDTCTAETVERYGLGGVLVAMIDCDTYSSSKLALDFVEPLLAESAVLIFDDWYTRNPDGTEMEGQRRAFHELLARRPELSCVEVGRPGFYSQAFRVSVLPLPDVEAEGPVAVATDVVEPAVTTEPRVDLVTGLIDVRTDVVTVHSDEVPARYQ
jgi:hypothetical protein